MWLDHAEGHFLATEILCELRAAYGFEVKAQIDVASLLLLRDPEVIPENDGRYAILHCNRGMRSGKETVVNTTDRIYVSGVLTASEMTQLGNYGFVDNSGFGAVTAVNMAFIQALNLLVQVGFEFVCFHRFHATFGILLFKSGSFEERDGAELRRSQVAEVPEMMNQAVPIRLEHTTDEYGGEAPSRPPRPNSPTPNVPPPMLHPLRLDASNYLPLPLTVYAIVPYASTDGPPFSTQVGEEFLVDQVDPSTGWVYGTRIGGQDQGGWIPASFVGTEQQYI
eukprot:TRINITY_DN9278_c0_g1_i1.p1 TRINITY_DN9278_c0_g1~~TRINITY_DN9278_c0_g1_i1.p1  ORF type:complete len:280 (+),score=9.66 TRINITY_DN9278_c0_g1_i1:411-1250(+)